MYVGGWVTCGVTPGLRYTCSGVVVVLRVSLHSKLLINLLISSGVDGWWAPVELGVGDGPGAVVEVVSTGTKVMSDLSCDEDAPGQLLAGICLWSPIGTGSHP